MEEKIDFAKEGRVKRFMAKYFYWLVVGFLLLAISLTVTLSWLATRSANIDDTEDVTGGAIVWGLPLTDFNIAVDYFADGFEWNATLGQYETHRGICFTPGSADLNVFAVLGGTVTAVKANSEDGRTIEITHTGGFKTVYSSLSDKAADKVNLKVGDVVAKGQTIGKVGNTSENWSAIGDHVHLAMIKDGQLVNPSLYLELGK